MSALSNDVFDRTDMPPGTTRAAEGLLRRRFTVAEIEAFVQAGLIAENERFELIGGEIVPMSPRGIRHERVKMWVMEALVRNLPRDYATNPETTFRLSDDTFLEPDFVVFKRASGLAGLNGETCSLAIEIGVSSLRYDRGRKAAIYAAFGIGEVWVIDAEQLTTRVFRKPGKDGYALVTDHGADAMLTPSDVPGFSMQLSMYEGFEG